MSDPISVRLAVSQYGWCKQSPVKWKQPIVQNFKHQKSYARLAQYIRTPLCQMLRYQKWLSYHWLLKSKKLLHYYCRKKDTKTEFNESEKEGFKLMKHKAKVYRVQVRTANNYAEKQQDYYTGQCSMVKKNHT